MFNRDKLYVLVSRWTPEFNFKFNGVHQILYYLWSPLWQQNLVYTYRKHYEIRGFSPHKLLVDHLIIKIQPKTATWGKSRSFILIKSEHANLVELKITWTIQSYEELFCKSQYNFFDLFRPPKVKHENTLLPENVLDLFPTLAYMPNHALYLFTQQPCMFFWKNFLFKVCTN